MEGVRPVTTKQLQIPRLIDQMGETYSTVELKATI